MRKNEVRVQVRGYWTEDNMTILMIAIAFVVSILVIGTALVVKSFNN